MNIMMIEDMFENTELTIEQIARYTGSTYKPVWSFIKKNYTRVYRDARKKRCYRNSKLGEKNPQYGKRASNYKGECADGKGYLTVYKPDWYTGRRGSERVFVHSIVMCEALGITEIPQGFVIHHIDGDKTNNNINNLALMNMSGHQRHHQLERATTISEESRVQEDSKRIVSDVERI